MLGRTQSVLVRAVSSYAQGPDGGVPLTIGELKQLLSERGVDYRDCLEKSDLAKRLSESAGQSKVAARPQRLARRADPLNRS